MKNKKRNRIFLLLILLLGISVGFAALATTLKINGSTIIGKNSWNIYWDNIDNQDGVTPTTSEIVDEDATHKNNIVNFAVTFNQPGDYYEFTVDAVNAGTLDAEILSIEKKYNNTLIPAVEDPEHRVVPAYLKYEVTYADDTLPTIGDGLAKAQDLTSTPPVYTTKTYKIRVEYDRDAVTNADINNQVGNVTHEFSFKVEYGQATPAPSAVTFSADSWATIAAEGNRAATQETVTDGSCGIYHIGDTKEVDLGDLGVHTVRISNCSTPSVCSTEGFSETSCGFVVEFADSISAHRYNPYNYQLADTMDANGNFNKGGWEYSEMRAYLNNGVYTNSSTSTQSQAPASIDYTSTGVFGKLPAELQTAIKTTTVVSSHGSRDSSNFITQDRLFLLAGHEVHEDTTSSQSFKNNDSTYSLTRQLDYYTGSTTSNYGSIDGAPCITYKPYNGNTSTYWWLRSANSGYFQYFYTIANGGWRNLDTYDSEYYVSPAFKLK